MFLPYNCNKQIFPHCQQSFRSKEDLATHIKQRHGGFNECSPAFYQMIRIFGRQGLIVEGLTNRNRLFESVNHKQMLNCFITASAPVEMKTKADVK